MSDCQRCAELKGILREVWEWSESEDVKAAFMSAWIHGIKVPEEQSQEAARMWERVKQALGGDAHDRGSTGGSTDGD